MNHSSLNFLYCALILFVSNIETKAQAPLFPNSVVSNDIDFIKETDPDSFVSLAFIGLEDKEMPSSISNLLFDENTFVFQATFSDNESLQIWCHSSFLTQNAAESYASKLCPRLGKLPVFQRNLLDHIVIHNGDAGAFAEIEGQFFVLYSDNMDERISTHDLEETVFHESVHASYQFMYQNDPSWIDAQSQDLAFVTEYAQDNPTLEDMAESALFAYTYITHPGRLTEDIEAWLETNIPNRLAWFREIYSPSTATIEINPISELNIYPNPTVEEFSFHLEDITTNENINIFNAVTGELVASIKAKKGFNNINIKDFIPGTYVISVRGFEEAMIIKQ